MERRTCKLRVKSDGWLPTSVARYQGPALVSVSGEGKEYVDQI